MTKHEKEVSRQRHLWLALVVIVLISVGSFFVELNAHQAMVLSAVVLGLIGKESAGLFSTPKGDEK
jgi:xanthine/uracil permease